MSFFDSHAHIGAPELLAEAEAILERARAAGVSGVLAVGAGYGIGANAGAVAVAEQHPDVWATVGVHPHDASEWNPLAERALEGWLLHRRVVAVGECGLDYHYDHSPRDAQQQCLAEQIRIAERKGFPLVIHARASEGSRDAFEDLLRIFDEAGAERVGGVIHCFTGDLVFAQDCLARGFDISFSGILTFKNAEELRHVAAALPLERLLIETDSPLLAPVPHRGKRNEPAFVVRVAECLAELHGTSVERLAQSTRERTYYAFRLEDAR
ncbi:MAG: TatD family hydrolase [Deltaproteobacteria bacterium]|nr:TatD family hydrolase [Deltaproteobacteria bacterium]